MNTIFRVGDKVFDIRYGWGVVNFIGSDNNNKVIDVDFSDVIESYQLDGRFYEYDDVPLLSFTEYTLNGFSLERPIELPEVGEEIMVSNDGNTWGIVEFKGYDKSKELPVICVDKNFIIQQHRYFKRLR